MCFSEKVRTIWHFDDYKQIFYSQGMFRRAILVFSISSLLVRSFSMATAAHDDAAAPLVWSQEQEMVWIG